MLKSQLSHHPARVETNGHFKVIGAASLFICLRTTSLNFDSLSLQWTSNKGTHFIYRCIMMIYSIGWFVIDVVTNVDPVYYAYVSHWTEILQCVYFSEFYFTFNLHKLLLYQHARVYVCV